MHQKKTHHATRKAGEGNKNLQETNVGCKKRKRMRDMNESIERERDKWREIEEAGLHLVTSYVHGEDELSVISAFFVHTCLC